MKKILLLEDEDVMITAIEFRLQKIGCKSFKAKTFDAAAQLLDIEKPDLAVISLAVEGGVGLRLLNFIRLEKKLKMPVIVLSTLEQEAEVLEAMEAGANDFTTKPFKPTELVLRVSLLLSKFQAG
jgi:two-component system, OmpR family, response regulator VicR